MSLARWSHSDHQIFRNRTLRLVEPVATGADLADSSHTNKFGHETRSTDPGDRVDANLTAADRRALVLIGSAAARRSCFVALISTSASAWRSASTTSKAETRSGPVCSVT